MTGETLRYPEQLSSHQDHGGVLNREAVERFTDGNMPEAGRLFGAWSRSRRTWPAATISNEGVSGEAVQWRARAERPPQPWRSKDGKADYNYVPSGTVGNRQEFMDDIFVPPARRVSAPRQQILRRLQGNPYPFWARSAYRRGVKEAIFRTGWFQVEGGSRREHICSSATAARTTARPAAGAVGSGLPQCFPRSNVFRHDAGPQALDDPPDPPSGRQLGSYEHSSRPAAVAPKRRGGDFRQTTIRCISEPRGRHCFKPSPNEWHKSASTPAVSPRRRVSGSSINHYHRTHLQTRSAVAKAVPDLRTENETRTLRQSAGQPDAMPRIPSTKRRCCSTKRKYALPAMIALARPGSDAAQKGRRRPHPVGRRHCMAMGWRGARPPAPARPARHPIPSTDRSKGDRRMPPPPDAPADAEPAFDPDGPRHLPDLDDGRAALRRHRPAGARQQRRLCHLPGERPGAACSTTPTAPWRPTGPPSLDRAPCAGLPLRDPLAGGGGTSAPRVARLGRSSVTLSAWACSSATTSAATAERRDRPDGRGDPQEPPLSGGTAARCWKGFRASADVRRRARSRRPGRAIRRGPAALRVGLQVRVGRFASRASRVAARQLVQGETASTGPCGSGAPARRRAAFSAAKPVIIRTPSPMLLGGLRARARSVEAPA